MKIVRTNRYTKDVKRIGASDADISRLEMEIAATPQAGAVIPGLGGLRKLRFAIGNRGKCQIRDVRRDPGGDSRLRV